MEEENIALDFGAWNIKLQDRTRDRMKLQVKLSKEEALAFKNFMGMVKPPDLGDQDFLKGIFKLGVETMEQKLMEAVKKHAEDNDMDLSAVGLSDTPTTSPIPQPAAPEL